MVVNQLASFFTLHRSLVAVADKELVYLLLIKSAIIFTITIIILIIVIIHFTYIRHNKYYQFPMIVPHWDNRSPINLEAMVYSFMVFTIIFIILVLKIIVREDIFIKVIIIRSCNSIIVIVFISIHYVSYYSHHIITFFIIIHLMFILVINYNDFSITVFKNSIY